jgi:RNA polymerase sigma-70 factor (ECF subfamily)
MDAHDLVDRLFRRQSGQLVATLTRVLGSRHVALAEDAVQDALVAALQQWPFRGLPERPEAWLFQVARNRALDRLRHHQLADDKAAAVALSLAGETPAISARLRGEAAPIEDDRLGLMCLTCHPTLPPESRVALTLKLAGGFSVGEIARAFLAGDSAVAQRLVRARRQLRDSGADFGLPAGAALAARVDSMQESIYLIFNEGYAATSGDLLVRQEIADEAIRLGRLLAQHDATGTPASRALLALMLLHAARFPARVGTDGELFLMAEQDRSRWDRPLIAEGLQELDRASAGAHLSRYHLEAGIAACHATAASWADTDWEQILDQYDLLYELTGSPVVAINRAIARSRVEGPTAGLAALDSVADDPQLHGYHVLPSVEAALWREAGRPDRAAACYRRALALAQSAPERVWLARRLEQTEAASAGGEEGS